MRILAKDTHPIQKDVSELWQDVFRDLWVIYLTVKVKGKLGSATTLY